MNLEKTKIVGFTTIFERNRDSRAKVIINVGGARSSKSYSVCQLFIYLMTTLENKTFGICRKTFPSLRMSAMKLFFDLLRDYGLYDERNHNKTFNTYSHGTNTVQFFGLDEAGKIRSTEFNYMWMEEANEFSYEEYINLKLRLSAPCERPDQNHLVLCLNPIDANNWIAQKAIKESDVEVIHSTFKDNPYLSKEYVELLTNLIHEDANFYRIYTLGEWGLLQKRIYTNFKVIPELPDMTGAKWGYGLDFGSANPSAVVKVYLLNDRLYLEEKLFKPRLTNSDIIEFFSHEPRGDIYADPTAKMMVAEIQRAGFSAFEGIRGVKESIDLCQRQTMFIPEGSTNLIDELNGYQWKTNPNDPNGGSLPEPIKYNDHLLDAMRYAIWGITSRYGFATARPRSLTPIKTLHFGSDVNKLPWEKR